MKKVLLLMSIFTGTMFVSCDEGLLEPFTPGALTEDVAIQTSTDLQGLMNSTYANMFSREDAVFTSVFTDEAGIGFANGGQDIIISYTLSSISNSTIVPIFAISRPSITLPLDNLRNLIVVGKFL